jgi:hypothetical protein
VLNAAFSKIHKKTKKKTKIFFVCKKMHNFSLNKNLKYDLQSNQLKNPFHTSQNLPPQHFYGKIITGVVATCPAIFYPLIAKWVGK